MARNTGKKVITILSLAIVLVLALQVLLQGNVGLASVEKHTLVDMTVTNKDVTVRVPFAEMATGILMLAR